MPIINPDYSDINYEDMALAIGLKLKHIPILIGSFLEESAPIIQKIESAIDATDYTAIKASSHSIKGSAGNLHFLEIYEMAKEMESAAGSSNASFDYAGYLDAIKKAVETIK